MHGAVSRGGHNRRYCPSLSNIQPIPKEHWQAYRAVIELARERNLPFALGGAIGVATYTGQWRYTKDLDLYITPETRDAMIQVVTECGLGDYYVKLAYDRSWIYRGNIDDAIVDLIWSMPNRRTEVDEVWITKGPVIQVHDEWLAVVPPEELLWAKLYVMQRERCDWPDIMNLLYAAGSQFDWEHLIERIGCDLPVLTGVLSLFRWLAPERARAFPGWLWRHVQLPQPELRWNAKTTEERAFLLDTRSWFIPAMGNKD